MNTYSVKVYVATSWSFLTQADHYEEYTFKSNETLVEIVKRLARDGFQTANCTKWVMPGAILEVRQL